MSRHGECIIAMEQVCIFAVLTGLPAKEVVAGLGGNKGADCNRAAILVVELSLLRQPCAAVQNVGDLVARSSFFIQGIIYLIISNRFILLVPAGEGIGLFSLYLRTSHTGLRRLQHLRSGTIIVGFRLCTILGDPSYSILSCLRIVLSNIGLVAGNRFILLVPVVKGVGLFSLHLRTGHTGFIRLQRLCAGTIGISFGSHAIFGNPGYSILGVCLIILSIVYLIACNCLICFIPTGEGIGLLSLHLGAGHLGRICFQRLYCGTIWIGLGHRAVLGVPGYRILRCLEIILGIVYLIAGNRLIFLIPASEGVSLLSLHLGAGHLGRICFQRLYCGTIWIGLGHRAVLGVPSYRVFCCNRVILCVVYLIAGNRLICFIPTGEGISLLGLHLGTGHLGFIRLQRLYCGTIWIGLGHRAVLGVPSYRVFCCNRVILCVVYLIAGNRLICFIPTGEGISLLGLHLGAGYTGRICHQRLCRGAIGIKLGNCSISGYPVHLIEPFRRLKLGSIDNVTGNRSEFRTPTIEGICILCVPGLYGSFAVILGHIPVFNFRILFQLFTVIV